MNILFNNGTFNTEDLHKEVNDNMVKLENASRNIPSDASRYPIGYVIPLGTLGNAPNQTTQFKSNFHIVAYTIADDCFEKAIDFEDFNTLDLSTEQGQILKLIKRINELSQNILGFGWKITLFNVRMSTAIDSMCKGNNDIDIMKKSIDDMYNIIHSRLIALGNKDDTPWKHELIELFYTPLKAMSMTFTKIIEKNSKNEQYPLGECNDIIIETLVYDEYANGLRLLTNTESFASSKIRKYENKEYIDSKDTYLFVLKARISGESDSFRPIRQFSGKSQISVNKLASGCSERIVYNLVNKNYKHWSFISIPCGLHIELKNLV